MRGFIFINKDLKKINLLIYFFDAYWKDNIDISVEENIKKILFKCNIDQSLFEKGIQEQKIKDELKNLTDKAFKLDVFGAPTFIVNNKLFWGQDRLEYALEEFNS